MLVGHYGVAIAAAAVMPGQSLVGLFVTTQLMDVTHSALLAAGVERTRISDGTGPEAVRLDSVPFSHSLPAAAVQAGLVGVVTAVRGRDPGRTAMAAGVALSHWPLDVLVHEPEIPLVCGRKVGAGLPTAASHAAEVLLLPKRVT